MPLIELILLTGAADIEDRSNYFSFFMSLIRIVAIIMGGLIMFKKSHKAFKRSCSSCIKLISLVCIILLVIAACGSGEKGNSPSEDPPVTAIPYDENPYDGQVHEISVDIDEDSWNHIRHTGHSPQAMFQTCFDSAIPSPYEFVEARVTVDGVTVENVGVRIKGFLGSINPVRPSLKIKFDEFIEGQTLGDIQRLTLNNNNQDGSRMRTYLTYDMFRKAGLPAPECGFARVIVNGKDLGVYSTVESIKKPFLRKWFDDDEGNLYEARMSDFNSYLINSWERKTNDLTADDRSDLEALMTILEADIGRPIDIDALSEVIDLEAFLGHWAMEIITGHWDGFSGNRNNTYLYNDPSTGKFTFIPWGPDAALSGSPSAIGINSVGSLLANDTLTNRLYDHPWMRAGFISILEQLYQVVWVEGAYLEEVDLIKQRIMPYVVTEYNEDFSGQVDSLYSFMQSHSDNVYQELIAATAPEYPYSPEAKCFPVDWEPAPQPFSFTFETRWGSGMGSGGSSVSEVDIPGFSSNGTYFIIAGLATDVSPDETAVIPPGMIDIMIMDFSSTMHIMLLRLSPYKFLSGEPIAFDNFATNAMIVSVVLADNSAALIGMVVEGTLTLTEAGMNENDLISGTFEGDLMYFMPSSN